MEQIDAEKLVCDWAEITGIRSESGGRVVYI